VQQFAYNEPLALRSVLTSLPLFENPDDFVFDNKMITHCVYFGFRVGEVSCLTITFVQGWLALDLLKVLQALENQKSSRRAIRGSLRDRCS